MEQKCTCEYEDLEEGSVLYILNKDVGFDFRPIRIKYCPVCGKKLKSDDE